MTNPSPFPPDRLICGSLCYIIQDGRVLLQQRNRPPHLGLWTAPGGKMELGESPDECVLREIYEETGLTIHNPTLCGIVTVNDIAYPIYWQLFIYRAEQTTGEALLGESREGLHQWIPLTDLDTFAMPAADRAYLPHILANDAKVFRAKFIYNTPDTCQSSLFY